MALGARPDVVSSLVEAANEPRRDCLSADALRVLLTASKSRVRSLPPTVPVCAADAKWKDKRTRPPRPAACPADTRPLTPRPPASVRPAAARCACRPAAVRRHRGVFGSSPSSRGGARGADSRRQGYTAYASAAIQLDRTGAVQARATVEGIVSSGLRFLGFRRNVERMRGQASFAEVLDGEAVARYVSFLLVTRCVRRAAARRRLAAAADSTPPPPRSERKPTGVATDVSHLVAIMAYVATTLDADERAAAEALQVRAACCTPAAAAAAAAADWLRRPARAASRRSSTPCKRRAPRWRSWWTATSGRSWAR